MFLGNFQYGLNYLKPILSFQRKPPLTLYECLFFWLPALFHPVTVSDCSSGWRTDINSQNSEEYQDFFSCSTHIRKEKKYKYIHWSLDPVDKPSHGLNIYTCLQQKYLLWNSNTVRQNRNWSAKWIVKCRCQAAEFFSGDKTVRSSFISFLIYYKYSRQCNNASCVLINRFRLSERKSINWHSSICLKSQEPRQFIHSTHQTWA